MLLGIKELDQESKILRFFCSNPIFCLFKILYICGALEIIFGYYLFNFWLFTDGVGFSERDF